MTNGTKMEINATGTQLKFRPGTLLGGEHHHECPIPDRSDGFWKAYCRWHPLERNPCPSPSLTDGWMCETDPSPDYWQRSALPLFSHFGIGIDSDDDIAPLIKVLHRAAAPSVITRDRFSFMSHDSQPVAFD
ncbi:hypothetical protein IV203_011104 [Nitzschia inconspicua]|uniref:Uncharacterized protein n=1 Tax=Nitzschia inconspicua TaxID=303405 RepID=A0A9K3K517_9STRA|nr:hypothetical protein IV203_011104 [Nitzschia inconspicua]